MIRIHTFYIIYFAVLILFNSSCDQANKISESDKIDFVRFDLDLLKFNLDSFETSDKLMKSRYGDLYSFYIEQIMGLGVQSDKRHVDYYQKFFSEFHKGEYRAMMDTCERLLFAKIPEMERKVSKAYVNYNANFKTKRKPKIFSFFISPNARNTSAAFSYGHDTIGINWFNYLGKDFTLYPAIYQGYDYMITWQNSEYLVRNIMLVEYNLWMESHPIKEKSDQLILRMIEEGKKYYFLDRLCENMSDGVKIGYTEEQEKWCRENELEIWAYFTSNKLLYSIDQEQQRRYLLEGPSTPGMPAESPGMVGSWLGWQIVKTFASKSGKSLAEVLQAPPSEVMKIAAYKPKK